MNFNLDLIHSEVQDFKPFVHFEHSSRLTLDRIELFTLDSKPRAESLFILSGEDYVHLDASFAHRGSFLVLGLTQNMTATLDPALPAIIVPSRSLQLPSPCNLLVRLTDYRAKLNEWSESMLAAMVRNDSLQDVFDIAATMFANPIMLSDAALYFTLIAGVIPDDFYDALWTPALETGVCPSELYSDAWNRSANNAFSRRKAYIVADATEQHRSYLIRNLIVHDTYHGCFELVDIHAPFTHADHALADYVGDLLALIIPQQTYLALENTPRGPIGDLLAGEPVRMQILEYGLEKIGWSLNDAFFVVRFTGIGEEGAAATRSQTIRRIAEIYPKARFFEDGDAYLMVARDVDHSLAHLHARHNAHDVAESGAARFQAGFSSLFTDFSLIRCAADQAAFAYRKVGASPHTGAFGISRTCFYNDCWLEDVHERLSLGTDASWLIDYSTERLNKADMRDGTDYIATALAYLENGCNATRTAEALFIHRNTLAYRLKRIKTLAGIDLENPTESGADLLRVFLSCKILGCDGD